MSNHLTLDKLMNAGFVPLQIKHSDIGLCDRTSSEHDVQLRRESMQGTALLKNFKTVIELNKEHNEQ